MNSHLIDIAEVRRLFAKRTWHGLPSRGTVNKWILKQRLVVHGPSEMLRYFERGAVVAALDADFPPEPQFITVEDAFHLAKRPYPHSRFKPLP